MRTLDFYRLPGLGPDEIPDRGTVADLLKEIPGFGYGGLIPPLIVVNAILATGFKSAGMSGGCRWSPIQLSVQEFEELVIELLRNGGWAGKRLTWEEAPSWVQSPLEWNAWVAFHCYSIPLEENLKLQREIDTAERLKDQAEERGDEGQRREQLNVLMNLSTQLFRLHRTYRKPRPKQLNRAIQNAIRTK